MADGRIRSFDYISADYNKEAYENALIELFQNMGWEYVYGPDVERDWHSPLYDSVLEDSIHRINPKVLLLP